jgi:serine/threonine-protein kinase
MIKSVLGEGATSTVYEAFDPDIARHVAIKALRPNLISGKLGEELLTRFRREAISAARCIHPNIVTILEYGQHENSPYIVMEYVDGVSVQSLIRHRLKHGRGISLRRSLSIVSQLLAALYAAHRFKIVHRDIKASNVLIVNGSGRIKLADFGMARISEYSDLTMIGSLIGTPRYMAPELRLGLEADFRADIFSAARLMLELLRMLPASSPFPRVRLPEIPDMPPGNRIDYSATYPAALVPVLLKGLEVDRKKRYQSVQDFMRAIKQALPDLRHRDAAAALQAATVEWEPVEDYPASEDELDSMTMLLADYVGPAAAMIMEEHETQSTSANNLANEISREIPEQQEQREFLARWSALSESRQDEIRRKRAAAEAARDRAPARSSPGQVLHRLGNEFAHYIGPLANSLLRHRPEPARNAEPAGKDSAAQNTAREAEPETR